MNETTEQIADGIWANLPLQEKVEILEKSGFDIDKPVMHLKVRVAEDESRLDEQL